jgi:dTMP kinase
MRKSPQEGIFITVEGPDGSGKSTQVDLLQAYLNTRNYPVLVTREPGGTPAGEAIRQILLEPGGVHELVAETELFLFAAGRAQHVCECIMPAISQGQIVIASRYIDASVAYQGYGRGLPLDIIQKVNDFATGGLKPDLTIILDIDTETGLNRARAVHKETPVGEADRIEAAGIDFHRRVRAGYLAIAAEEPERCVVIDSSRTICDIAEDICCNVRKHFNLEIRK